MDKRWDETKNMIEDARLRVQELAELVNEIDAYLVRLHKDAQAQVEPINEAMRTGTEVPQAEIDTALARRIAADDWTTDPRRPYIAGRQPRRDGDSYGSVQPEPTEGGRYGSQTERVERRRRVAKGKEKA